MPQMSPMNWLMLMFMFTMILIMCISLMYFIYLPNNINNKLNNNYPKLMNNYMNWKW